MKNFRRLWKWLAGLAILFIGYRILSKQRQVSQTEASKIALLPQQQRILKMLKLIKQNESEQDPGIICAQGMHESDDFTSDIFISNNNCFGMRMPSKRKTTAIKEENGYAYYGSVEDCIKDLQMWWNYESIDRAVNVIDYIQKIKEVSYFLAPYWIYENGVEKKYNELQSLL